MPCPSLGLGAAGILFAVTLLVAGQNFTSTEALAGQIVTESSVGATMPNWACLLIARGPVIILAALVAG